MTLVEPMLALVGDGQIEMQDQKLVYSQETGAWYLRGVIDDEVFMENLTDVQEAEITLVCRFQSG